MPKIPGINHLQAVKALEKAGFRIVRQGKHIVMSDGTRFLYYPKAQSCKCPNNGWYRKGRRVDSKRIPKTIIEGNRRTIVAADTDRASFVLYFSSL